MPTIVLKTHICATPEVCFDLIRDERVHIKPAPAIFGDLGLGQMVTFKSSYFGATQTLTVTVVDFDRPRLLVDEMTEGNFLSFKHIHEFVPSEMGTLMTDTLIWTSRLGMLGRIADSLLLKRHLTRLVSARNARLKEIAESLDA